MISLEEIMNPGKNIDSRKFLRLTEFCDIGQMQLCSWSIYDFNFEVRIMHIVIK